MKTRKTFFHRAVCMFLTAVMAVTLFTVAAPTEAQAAGLSFKGNGKSTVTIKDTQCYSGRNLKVNYIKFKPSDRKSTRLNSSHNVASRMTSSA